MRYGRGIIAIAAITLAAGHLLLLAAVSHIGLNGSISVLIPGLVLVGAGMGLGITPLITTVLANVQRQHAGAASAALSTVQQLGNAVGVAVTGVLFFGTLNAGCAPAFETSLVEFAVLLMGVAALTRLLPARPA